MQESVNTYVKKKDKVVFEICCDYCARTNKFLLSLLNDYEEEKWRFNKFQEYIFDMVSEAALTKEERESLYDKPMRLLNKACSGLNQKEGEIAEIFLYGVMKDYYKALPVVPKIFYKQNSNDPIKGADSVHITVENEECHVWLGEAKFYKDIKGAINEAIDSIQNMLNKDKLKKERSYIVSFDFKPFMEDEKYQKEYNITSQAREKIEKILNDNTSIDELKKILHIPILIIHECGITGEYKEFSEDYKKKIKDFHQKKANQMINKMQFNIHNVDKIKFHIILFPVPNKEEIVEAYKDEVKHRTSKC